MRVSLSGKEEPTGVPARLVADESELCSGENARGRFCIRVREMWTRTPGGTRAEGAPGGRRGRGSTSKRLEKLLRAGSSCAGWEVSDLCFVTAEDRATTWSVAGGFFRRVSRGVPWLFFLTRVLRICFGFFRPALRNLNQTT